MNNEHINSEDKNLLLPVMLGQWFYSKIAIENICKLRMNHLLWNVKIVLIELNYQKV